MSTWYTSDIHFGHVNIIKYENRPFADVDEMNEGIIDRWNGQVDPFDAVIIVGDICMGKTTESLQLISRLNGFKMLRCGNHDRPWVGNKTPAKDASWVRSYMDAGLPVVDDGFAPARVTIGKQDYRLDHFPYEEIDRHGDRFADYSLVDNGEWLIHGHVHSAWRQKGRQINVGLDPWGGRLVSEEEIRDLRKAGEQDLPAIPWTPLRDPNSPFANEIPW